jgi:hypothetical protein
MFNISFIFIKSINIGICRNKKVCKIVLQKQYYAENRAKILFGGVFLLQSGNLLCFAKKIKLH